MTNLFFAAINDFGSESSVGFDNTLTAVAFKSRITRDNWVDGLSTSNLSVRAITKAEALKLATRNGRELYVTDAFGGMVRV